MKSFNRKSLSTACTHFRISGSWSLFLCTNAASSSKAGSALLHSQLYVYLFTYELINVSIYQYMNLFVPFLNLFINLWICFPCMSLSLSTSLIIALSVNSYWPNSRIKLVICLRFYFDRQHRQLNSTLMDLPVYLSLFSYLFIFLSHRLHIELFVNLLLIYSFILSM